MRRESGIFNFSGLAALSGAIRVSPNEKVPIGRPRVKSDNTAILSTFGKSLSNRLQNQLTISNESKDKKPNQAQAKL